MRIPVTGICFCCGFLLLISCQEKQKTVDTSTSFTKTDSVTERYLELKDGMLESWNRMVSNDNQRIKAMQNLIHELKVSTPALREDLALYDEKLKQLKEMRYSQQSIANGNIVEEFDFASNTLVVELISLAESQPEFDYNTTLQKIIQKIRTADQRVVRYREQYDSVAGRHNQFIDEHRNLLQEIDSDSFIKKLPLFYTTAAE